ncbi:peptidylprolyl isomerase [Candidatus Thioglobus sp.]|nr:peptidylprolyl isomerase [Candidatus Thioglobus sp.]
MKHGLYILLLLASLTTLSNEVENSIVALVNEKIITSQSIQLKLDKSNTFDEKLIILNEKIDLVLQKELIDKTSLNASVQEIKDALEHIANKNDLSLNQLTQLPNYQSIFLDISNTLSIMNLKNSITKDLKFITTDEELNVHCSNKDKNQLIKQIKIAEIIISSIGNSELNKDQDKDIKKFLLKLSDHIIKGASFQTIAKLHSQDPSYFNGGLSGWKNINNATLMEIDKLQKNEVSKIFKGNNGWTIATKINERYIDTNVEECKKELNTLKAEKYYLNYLKSYRDEAEIKIFIDEL